ncbi:heme biosynthesis protein HemY [Pseudoxanthomonas helianthi]|uniref:Heme biosynthesis protein HemY n=1 Tax=Pseudoxanthomonas helianthi TaxID=1453541 RepID=A0A940X147_9GAMM|nr:heme biosynthesis HemY N-terminal domain-containing protein [Pseudoxanthomonas helianthi]MBP3984053.1 heme biosynthesis protein HemY [Pseudoxanthomonas helianthi]
MKKWIGYAVILLVVVLVGALGSQWLAHNGRDFGEVFLRVGGYDYSASLPGALLALLIAGLALWLLWSLLALPFRAWGRYRRKQGRARLTEGLEALHGGHWQRAETLLDRAAHDSEVGTIARIAATRAAVARGDEAGVQKHLSALQAHSPAAHAVAAAELALARQDAAAALDSLSAAAAQPLPPRGLVLQAQALVAQNRAAEAYGLLGAIRQQQALAPTEFAALEAQLAAQTIAQAGDANQLAERWESLPKTLRAEPAIVAAYAERAAALRWEDAATRALEQAIDARWDESLVALYGRLPVAKLDSRRASAQRWLSTHPSSPALLVTLAQLARLQGQWPQAQDFLHRALAQGAGADAWEELGHGYAAAGDELLARRSYANALNAARGQATTELPGRDLKQRIRDEVAVEERDEHGVPRLRG